MELFLNALWLALAIAGPLVWLIRNRAHVTRREIFAGLLTLACVAVLLFPIVSASDDASALQPSSEQRTVNARFDDYQAHGYIAAPTASWTATLAATWALLAIPVTICQSRSASIQLFNRPPPAR